MLLLAPLASSIPLAVLAAVLFVVAWNMGEWREIPGILRLEAADIAVWMITFALTVMADLTIAVEAGLALAALLYIYRVTETTSVSVATPEYIAAGEVHSLQGKDGAAVRDHPAHSRPVPVRDDRQADRRRGKHRRVQPDRHPAPAQHDRHRRDRPARAGAVLAISLRRSGRTLLVCGARHQPAKFLEKAEFVEEIGRENITPHVEAALARARELAPRLHG